MRYVFILALAAALGVGAAGATEGEDELPPAKPVVMPAPLARGCDWLPHRDTLRHRVRCLERSRLIAAEQHADTRQWIQQAVDAIHLLNAHTRELDARISELECRVAALEPDTPDCPPPDEAR